MALTQISTDGIKDGTITGADLATNVDLVDNKKIRFGTGNDLEIYHDGSHSRIVDTGTGVLSLQSNDCRIHSVDASKFMAKFVEDGAVELYHNNVKKFETHSAGVKVSDGNLYLDRDNAKVVLGASDDLQIYHDGTDSILKDTRNSGTLRIQADSIGFNDKDVSETMLLATADGSVDLYYDGSKKFETTSNGVTVTGNAVASSKFRGNDNVKLSLGDSEDLRIYHNGTNSIISNHHEDLYIDCQSDDLYLKAADNIFIQPQAGENGININGNGAVEIYYDNSKKLETQSDGAKVTGTFLATGALYTQNEFNMTSQGNKFIDTAHKDHTLHFRRINDGDGGHVNQCTVSSDGVWSADFNDTSDKKLKENITTISDGAINKVKQLRPVNFDWKETDKANNVSGFIAQEIKTVLPNLVYGTEYDSTIVDEQTQHIKSTGYSVNTIGIVAHLTKALQEAITKIEVLETEVAALKAS